MSRRVRPPAPPPDRRGDGPPVELVEPPPAPDGVLVPGSPFDDAEWAMAAHRMAAGWPLIQVARALGCHRSTLWRAYHESAAFRARVEWERACQQREARARVRALGTLAVARVEMALMQGDLATARWVVDRLFGGRALDDRALPLPPGPDVPDPPAGGAGNSEDPGGAGNSEDPGGAGTPGNPGAAGTPDDPGGPERPPLGWLDAFAPDLPGGWPAGRR